MERQEEVAGKIKKKCNMMHRICQVNLKLTYDATKSCLNLFKLFRLDG